MMNRIDNKSLRLILSSALVLFFISDALNKYFQVKYALAVEDGDVFSNTISVSIYVRFLFELIFLYRISTRFNKTALKGVTLMGWLFAIFIFGQVIFLFNYNNPDFRFGYQLTLFNKYIFVFIVYYAICDLVDYQLLITKTLSILGNIYIANSILIFLGATFNITLFKSYFTQDFRYGYDGLIPAINEATLFYMIGVSYFYFNYINKIQKIYPLLLCTAASLLLGAKAIYLFLFILAIYHIFFKAKLIYKFISLGFLALLAFGLFTFLISEENSYLYEYFIYKYEENGFLDAITSGRSAYIYTKFFDNLEIWNPVNYLFGGTDQLKFMIEMDFFDGFLIFGFVGIVIYFRLYFITLFRDITLKDFRLFFCISFFLLAFLVGHFFASAMNSLYLNLVVLYFYSKESDIKNLTILKIEQNAK
ncbi:hypothetical protein [uncultured Pedobacter sp.]|uniref:hypothetical protein n=1 Tax=uncultured Pedobacter sp. TaxID=246139 RepID=UPI0025D99BA1|nr:hypothetical protein [uncultured Pedobacter sp.]